MKTKLILSGLLAIAAFTKAQNVFPTPSGNAEIGSNGVITANHQLEIYGTTGGKNLGIGGVSPVIDLYGGNVSHFAYPPVGCQWGRVALATGANHFVNGSNAGDLVIETMGTSSMPLQAGSNGRSILFSSRYDGVGNCVEHMRINENGRVGIGTFNAGPSALDNAKLRIFHYDDQGDGVIDRFGTQSSIEGISPICSDCYQAPLIGVGGEARTSYPDVYQLKGVQGKAFDGLNNWGGYFSSTSKCEDSRVVGSANFGVQAIASGNYHSYGVWAEAKCSLSNEFAVWSNGASYATASWLSSDRKLKENIKPLTNALDNIMKLNPSVYKYKTLEFANMNLPEEQQIGLIAQDVELVFPEIVKQIQELAINDENGKKVIKNPDFKAVNYIELIPVLIGGIQEQQSLIEAIKKQLEDQKQIIAELNEKVATSTGLNTLSNIEVGFEMSQNEPNPFTHETIIKYTLPQTTASAFMAVYDLTGKQIATFPIEQKGSSSITINSQKLSAGIYIYSIVADGKVMDSKRMIVSEK